MSAALYNRVAQKAIVLVRNLAYVRPLQRKPRAADLPVRNVTLSEDLRDELIIHAPFF